MQPRRAAINFRTFHCARVHYNTGSVGTAMSRAAPLQAIEPRSLNAPKDEAAKVSLILGDFVVTALWVLVSSTFAQGARVVAQRAGTDEYSAGLGITVLGLILIGPLCNSLGGAIFNPVHNVAFMVVGRGSCVFNFVRMLSQLLGALVGSRLAVVLLPPHLKDHFWRLPGGLKQGVSLRTGVICEMLLGLVLNYVILIATSSSKNKVAAYWAPIAAAIGLNIVGSLFTGPSLNPAVTFSWYWHFQGHSVMEQAMVYWLGPFLGAVLAGLVFMASRRRAGVKSKTS